MSSSCGCPRATRPTSARPAPISVAASASASRSQRAVLGKPRLLVLDEPNSNLDTEGEARLAAALQEMKKSGATIVIVSHRMSLFGLVDYIAVMREGQLEKFGP